MYLKDLSNIIYVPGTASENTPIKIVSHRDKTHLLWSGKAKDLQHDSFVNRGWIIVEILIDHDAPKNISMEDVPIPDYNMGKIITVI